MEAVCEISAKLLETMEQDKEYLGRVFLYMSKFFFEVYTVYCKNHNLATICLRKVGCVHIRTVILCLCATLKFP